MNLTNKIKGRYLKMVNPSIGTIHIEGVPTQCNTVLEALHERKPPEMRKIPVHENGMNWYQQGDVCIWPKDAESLRPEPYVLT